MGVTDIGKGKGLKDGEEGDDCEEDEDEEVREPATRRDIIIPWCKQ